MVNVTPVVVRAGAGLGITSRHCSKGSEARRSVKISSSLLSIASSLMGMDLSSLRASITFDSNPMVFSLAISHIAARAC